MLFQLTFLLFGQKRANFRHSRLRSTALMLGSLLLAGLGSPSHAQTTFYWDHNGFGSGLGGSGTWSTSNANWNNSGDPFVTWSNSSPTDHAIFQNTAGTVTLGSDITVRSITFFTDGYSVSGSDTLTFDGGTGIINSSTGSQTISAIIAGNDGLTKTGSGTLTLSGANTYTGTTTINAGKLTLQNTNASSLYSIANGSTLELHTASDLNLPTSTFSGTGTLLKTGASGLAWGAGAATFSLGSGSLIDVQTGTFTGGSNANEVWTNNLSSLNVSGGAIFDGVEANVRVDALTGSGTIKSGYPHASYTNFTFGVDNGSDSFAGVLANSNSAGSFAKIGTGTQTLSGVNTYTGTTTISGGTLHIASGGSISHSSSNLFVGLNSGDNGTLGIASGGLVSNQFGIIGAYAGSSGTADVSGMWTNAHAFGLYVGSGGNGTLNLNNGGVVNVNGGAGTTTIASAAGSAGTINLNGSTTVGILNTATINGGLGTATLNFNHTNPGYHFNKTGASGGAAIAITGSTAVNHLGSGTTTLYGTNTYTGGTTVSNGRLNIAASGSITHSAANTVVGNLSGGQKVLVIDAGGSLSDNITVIGENSGSSGLVVVRGTLTNSSRIIVGNSGNGTLTIDGGGVLNVNSGAGVISLAQQAGSSGTLFLNNGSPFATNAASIFGGSGSAKVIFYPIGYDLFLTKTGTSSGTAVPITGSTSVEVDTSSGGTVNLSGANTYSGGTTVFDGTLNVISSGSIFHTIANTTVGKSGGTSGTLNITSGSSVRNYLGILGADPGTSGHANISGTWINTGDISVGQNGAGTLTIQNGGTVDVIAGTGTTTLASGAGSVGNLFITGIATPGVLNTAAVHGGLGTSTLNFNHTDSDYHFTRTGASGGTAIPITGSASLNHLGSGTTTLTATNTYTGGTTLSAGTLKLSSGGSISHASSPVSIGPQVSDNATLQIGNGSTVSSSLVNLGTVAGSSGTLNINGNTTPGVLNAASVNGGLGTAILNFNHTDSSYHFTTNGESGGTAIPITGSTTVQQIGSGTTTLSGSNTYTGGTTVSAGSLNIASGGSISHPSTPTYVGRYGGDNANLYLPQGSSLSTSVVDIGSVSGSTGRLFVTGSTSAGVLNTASVHGGDGGATLWFSHSVPNYHFTNNNNSGGSAITITGSTVVKHTGTGTTTLRGANTYTGGTTISAGSLIGDTTSLQGPIINNAALTFDQNTNGTYAGNLSGSGSLNKLGTGTITFSGSTTDIGAITISYGTLNVASGGSITHNSESTYVGRNNVHNGTLTIASGGSVSDGAGVIGNAGGSTGTARVSGTWTTPSLIVGRAGTGTLEVQNGGTINLNSGSGTATIGQYSGGNGTLNITGSTAAGVLNAATVRGGSGPAVLNFNHTDASHHFTSNGASNGSAVDITGTVTLNHLGTGTTILTGANTYSGGTTISAGTLQGNTTSLRGNITNNATLAFDQTTSGTFGDVISGTGSVTKLGAGTLTLSGANTYAGGTLISAGTLQGTSSSLQGDVSNNAALVFDQSASGSYAGVISGTGTVTKLGTGTFTFSGANSYSGATTVATGTIAVAGPSALGTGILNLNGAALQATGGSATLPNAVALNANTTISGSDALTLSGAVTLSGFNSLNITNSAQTTLSGPIGQSGFSVLIKEGSGELQLTGANTYTGGTSIADGTVRINNSTGSAFGTGAVTIASGATLTGAGSFSGALQVNGIFAPGNSPGLAEIGSGSSLVGITQFELGGTLRATDLLNGSGHYDAIKVLGAGALTVGGTLELISYEGFNPAPGDTFQLFDATSISGTFASINPSGFAPGITFNTSALYSSGTVSISAVPEPNTFVFLASILSIGIVGTRHRRKPRSTAAHQEM